MNKLERRKKELAKFKKRLKLMANCGMQVMVNGKWRNTTSWDQLLNHHELKQQATPAKDSKWKKYNEDGRSKIAHKRVQEQLEDIDEYINIKSRFSDVKDKTYKL